MRATRAQAATPRRRARRAIALTLAAAMFAAACGGDDDDDADPGVADTAGTTASVDETTPGSEPAESEDAGELDPNAKLTLDVSVDLTNLDPHKATYSFDMNFLEAIYDRLFDITKTGEVIPMLATEYEWVDDGAALDLTLREGVVFHDGTPFDAEAVKANIERAKTLEGSAVAVELTTVDSVEVIDETHVRLNMAQPDASLLTTLANRAGAMISPAAFDKDLSQEEAGAGPYTLKSFTSGASYRYERFEDYWDPTAAGAAELEIRLQADANSRLNAVRSGETDITTINAVQYEEAQGIDGLVVTANPGTTYNQLLLNRNRSHFADLKVRQALYHAIDRQGICDALMFGLCDLSVQPIIPGHWAESPTRPADFYAYDPDKARELLAEAGLPDGFSFTLMTPAGLAPYPEIAEILQAQLAEVGIEAELVPVEPAQMGERMLVRQDTDALLGGVPGAGDPSRVYAAGFLSTSINNPGGHTTERMEELYQKSINTFDQDERQQVMWETAEEAVDQVLAIVIAFPNSISVTRDDVVGYETGSLRGYFSVRGVGIAAS
jgi:peptide/nickel transport system substrate-binding protein